MPQQSIPAFADRQTDDMYILGMRCRLILERPGYAVSDCGKCLSFKRKKIRILPFYPCKKNHLRVHLFREGKIAKRYIHRLVLIAFVGPCPPGMECCHEDGDPTNNRLENLRWDTPEANWKDRKKHGRARSWAKFSDDEIAEVRRLISLGVRHRDIMENFGMSERWFYSIKKGAVRTTLDAKIEHTEAVV